MAHKHNRRRIRHRSRRNKHEQSLPTLYETCYDSLYDSPPSLSEPRIGWEARCQSRRTSGSSDFSDASVLRHWLDTSVVVVGGGQSSSPISRPYGISYAEAQALQTFGGEPGDDFGLCGKMQEMFDSMDWMRY